MALTLVALGVAPRLVPRVLAAAASTARLEPVAAEQATPAAEAPPLVRVLIRQQTSLALAAAAPPLRLADGQGRPLAEIAPEQSFELRQEQAGLMVVIARADGAATTLGPLQGDLWIVPLPAVGRSPLLTVEGHLYRGRLQVRAGGDGRLLVINQLPLERYLPSVVGSEMPASWPLAALRAQAVAARTYAISQLKPKSLFDLKATVDSQVYRGVESETDSTRTAVASTRSQVLMQDNAMINAVFHSSSGGNTEDSGEVWSRQLPYLVSVPDFDERSPVRQWKLRIEPDQLRRAFRETAGVSRIDVLAVSRTGRIRRARVSGPAGSLELTGAELRQRLGLRSTLVQAFRLEPVAQDRLAPPGVIAQALLGAQPVSPRPNATALDAAAPSAAESLWDSATGAISSLLAPPPPPPPPPPPQLQLQPLPQASASGSAGGSAGEDRATPIAPSPSKPALELVVEGRGFGHGVGMSQWGAYAMALQGRSHEQILRHYYRGVELKPYINP
ncbi:MAG: SpoIID/LytB domain-containing protein [Cyanobacteria bacterium]|nr:SpoIID/LytB domain-containing protein [Cyanobacteriota bacterium]